MTDSMFVSAARAARRPNRLPKLWTALCALLALLAPVAAGAAAPPPPPPASTAAMTVVRVVAGRVDVDVPGSRRPAVGSRLVVERDGVTIADLEVTILRDHQASCRIVRMTAPIAGGDLVLAAPSGKPAKAASGNAPTAAAGSAEPAPQADDASEHPSNQTMIVQRVLRGAVDISLVGSAAAVGATSGAGVGTDSVGAGAGVGASSRRTRSPCVIGRTSRSMRQVAECSPKRSSSTPAGPPDSSRASA